MKKLHRCFYALLLLVLELSFLQAASAEGYLYLFTKDFPPGDFNAVEALQEEKSDGNLKLTSPEGKLTVWGENLLAARFPLFDGAKEAADPAALQASITAMEKFVEESPGSKGYLQSLINQRKELQVRMQNKTVEVVQTTDDALGRFLSDVYNPERTYSVEYLEAKLKRGEQFKQLLPDQTAKIEEYLKPFAEELKNRNAGLDRFEGKWVSVEAVVKMSNDKIEAERKAFLSKALSFSVPQEAVSQNGVYAFLGVIGISALVLLIVLFHGLSNMSQGFGLGVLLSLLFGLGGLGLYGYGAWMLFQPPPGYGGFFHQAAATGTPSEDKMPVDEFIFRISQTGENQQSLAPGRYLLEEPALDTFLGTYVKIESASKPDAFAIVRKGLKVRILVDRILIFDELTWCKKDLVARYTFFYASNNNGFEFYKTEACLGGVPLPGKLFKLLWEQVQPVVGEMMTRSKVLDNYHVSRMENGMIELISNRNPPKAPVAP